MTPHLLADLADLFTREAFEADHAGDDGGPRLLGPHEPWCPIHRGQHGAHARRVPHLRLLVLAEVGRGGRQLHRQSRGALRL